ncbi:hypothetical protein [Fodinibius saliphilus]|uniref:hypothetical protein n=1 Tax=Fodinibius saliphilus TaxID=1920650 RepID=UPI0011081D9A|nr:hypothetical protein [Fodinibius saliphilus]
MDIFKLFFNHDQRLDKLAKRNANKSKEEVEATLSDFMKPDLTYSKFYLTGTKLEEEQFGLNKIEKYQDVLQQLDNAFINRSIHTAEGNYQRLSEAIDSTTIGQVLIISSNPQKEYNFELLQLDEESNVGHKKEELSEILKDEDYVIYKEQAHHGFDLHLFSLENIYPLLFTHLKPLVDNAFRFFSINSKRMGSERHFYFETWTLGNPPHGAEEVFTDTTI